MLGALASRRRARRSEEMQNAGETPALPKRMRPELKCCKRTQRVKSFRVGIQNLLVAALQPGAHPKIAVIR